MARFTPKSFLPAANLTETTGAYGKFTVAGGDEQAGFWVQRGGKELQLLDSKRNLHALGLGLLIDFAEHVDLEGLGQAIARQVFERGVGD